MMTRGTTAVLGELHAVTSPGYVSGTPSPMGEGECLCPISQLGRPLGPRTVKVYTRTSKVVDRGMSLIGLERMEKMNGDAPPARGPSSGWDTWTRMPGDPRSDFRPSIRSRSR